MFGSKEVTLYKLFLVCYEHKCIHKLIHKNKGHSITQLCNIPNSDVTTQLFFFKKYYPYFLEKYQQKGIMHCERKSAYIVQIFSSYVLIYLLYHTNPKMFVRLFLLHKKNQCLCIACKLNIFNCRKLLYVQLCFRLSLKRLMQLYFRL